MSRSASSSSCSRSPSTFSTSEIELSAQSHCGVLALEKYRTLAHCATLVLSNRRQHFATCLVRRSMFSLSIIYTPSVYARMSICESIASHFY